MIKLKNLDKEYFIHKKNLDENTKKQFLNCFKEDFVIKGALMPDAHFGYDAPIGSVFLTKEFIVPSWIGFDIGCGISTYKLINSKTNKKIKEIEIEKFKQKIFENILENIPMGLNKLNHIKNVSKDTKEEFKKIFDKLKSELSKLDLENEISKENLDEINKLLKEIKNKSISNLGSLGSGNHFIELEKDNENNLYLTLHTGSRNIGHKIAEIFMKFYKKNKKEFQNEKIYFKIYLFLEKFGEDFAKLNRREIIRKFEKIINQFINTKLELITETEHNFIEELKINSSEKYFLIRKGAIKSCKNKIYSIPGNMKDGTLLVKGKGNERFLWSASHGAGRKFSITESRKKINLENELKDLENVLTNLNEKNKHESPNSYNDINQVLNEEKESIELIKILKPIINWKG